MSPEFESSRETVQKRGLNTLAEPDNDEFANDVPRDLPKVSLIT